MTIEDLREKRQQLDASMKGLVQLQRSKIAMLSRTAKQLANKADRVRKLIRTLEERHVTDLKKIDRDIAKKEDGSGLTCDDITRGSHAAG